MLRITVALVLVLASACADGRYRLPYTDGEQVLIRRDFVTHSSPRAHMYDMEAVGHQKQLRAAASGWVRFIEDGNDRRGEGNNNFVWIEHPYPFCQDPADPARATWPGKPASYHVTCRPCTRRYCNEWTVYAHMAHRSVTVGPGSSAGLSEGDWVEAGQLIGVEDAIGGAGTPSAPWQHLHWHVARISPDWTPSANGDYESHLLSGRRAELIPIVCTGEGNRVLLRNRVYAAAPCPSPGELSAP
jgi:hypothetical protein